MSAIIIAFALRVRGMSAADRRKAADAMIEKVRLTELADRCRRNCQADSSSASHWHARLSPARGCCCWTNRCPPLDEQLRVQNAQELRGMQRDLGVTFIHVTHTQLEAIAIADLVVVMEKGKIKQAGPARERL